MSMVFMSAFSLGVALEVVGAKTWSTLEVEEPTGRGLDPFLRRVLVEYAPLVGRRDAPRSGRHLDVELAGAPARIAQTEQCPARTGAAGDRLQDARVVGDREVLVDHGRALARPVRCVQDEASA